MPAHLTMELSVLKNIEPGLYRIRRHGWYAKVVETDYLAPYFPLIGEIADTETGEIWPCKWDICGRFIGDQFESDMDLTKPVREGEVKWPSHQSPLRRSASLPRR